MAADNSPTDAKFRLYILTGILCLWLVAICFRLVYLQVFRYGDFEQRAQHQQQRSFDLSPKRGIIFDRAGHELAMSIQVDSAFAVPTEIPDLANTISLIARITKDDPRVLLADCKSRKTFCWVARKADAEVIERIKGMNLQGIHFQKEAKRFYPKRELAAQMLGYVGTDDQGLSGLERQFNSDLQGKPGKLMISVDARKRWFSSVEKQPEPGNNVVLTVDQNIQYIAERELETAMAETKAVAGTVIVQNPHTGEILALANRPTFNPNLRKEITTEALKDRAVSDVYEPGSAFKIVTISAGLEEKVTHPDELFDCRAGAIVINGLRIRDSKQHGVLSVSDIIAESSNVGAIKVALRLGDDRLYKYIRAFGFGQQTGIELPGETRGITKPVNRWSKVSIGAISMGQEIGISPLQLIGLVSTIANDGVWVAPRIVAGTVEPQNAPQTISFQTAEGRRVISSLTAAQMRQMLQGVVLHGTGRKAILEGYSSAGKTGTGQEVDPRTHTYSKTRYNASFAGFAPVNDPKISVAVILDSPVGLHQGGQVSAPVFQRVTQQVLEYLHVPHDVEIPPNRQLLLARRNAPDKDLDESSPDHLGSSLDVAEVSDTPVVPAQSKSATIAAQVVPAALTQREPSTTSTILPSPSAKLDEVPEPKLPTSGTVVLDVEEGGIAVPSFLGKSVRSAVEAAQDVGLDLDAVGSGTAREQSPAPGAKVAAGSRVMVKFGR
ncbi:MAG TPA: penicillin-binding transpeptidase domain-containing protein [Terriglobales bacterium]|jgi:cell division protein FtsI (penicillin-binding protein 3)|nr:penicillin-binding transpeptidase domain-containing protein [Terriglobales bacterium]